MRLLCPPSPTARIVISKHADARLHERAPELDLDMARDEIAAALLSRRFRHQGRRHWLCWTPGGRRAYAFAWPSRDGAIVVMSVMADYAVAA